ncbi:MAG TPA: DUF554 domain-containing protein [Acidimicrobiales bacterium]|nr:DUF554 domain-containing protein [Acidimicrobiales bacterium]
MRGLGTAVNVVTVLVGAGIGVAIGHRFPLRWRTTLIDGLGLLTLVVGVDQGIKTHNAVFPVVAIVLGGLIGEALDLEDRLEGIGARLRRRFARGDDASPSSFVEGFVSASLIFCVGPLAILGAIQDGLGIDSQLLLVKSALDGIVAAVFASTLGWGVAFSALSVLVYQGGFTLMAGAADSVLTDRMIIELTATGGVMLVGIALRLLEVRPVRVGSFIPALLVAPVAVGLFAR